MPFFGKAISPGSQSSHTLHPNDTTRLPSRDRPVGVYHARVLVETATATGSATSTDCFSESAPAPKTGRRFESRVSAGIRSHWLRVRPKAYSAVIAPIVNVI